MDTTVSPETMQKVIEKINMTFKNRNISMKNCSVCDEQNSFNVMDAYVVMPVSNKGNQINLSGKNMPMVTLVCAKCGNTIFLNALAIGLGNDLFDQGAL